MFVRIYGNAWYSVIKQSLFKLTCDQLVVYDLTKLFVG